MIYVSGQHIECPAVVAYSVVWTGLLEFTYIYKLIQGFKVRIFYSIINIIKILLILKFIVICNCMKGLRLIKIIVANHTIYRISLLELLYCKNSTMMLKVS